MRLALGLLFASSVPMTAFAVPTVLDASFEAPAVSGYAYDPTGTPWTFTSSAGISANPVNGGAFYVAPTPDGQQAAFIQSNYVTAQGQISQMISGLTVGTAYAVTFYAAQRGYGYAPDPIDVSFGGTDLGTYTPASTTTFVQYNTTYFIATATSGLLSFLGAVSQADIASAIDLVGFTVPEPASLALLGAGVAAAIFRRKRV